MVRHTQIWGRGNSRAARRASYLSNKSDKQRDGENQDDARPRSTACRNASPADCGADSLAKVPAFIAANTFTGFVSFWAGPAAADDGCENDGAMPLLNDGCPKPGLNPVGSVNIKRVQHNAR